ncbi:MAG TPA: DUF3810 domain-containing protein [Puia sp.]|nr:DUF3810 domain-containing protein [Puia sp.]
MFGKTKYGPYARTGRGPVLAWICLVVLAAGIKILSLFPGAVERYYAMGFYPLIARLQRILFGWLPFSIGDLLYGALIIWLIVGLVRLVRRLVKRQVDGRWLLGGLRRTLFVCLLVYVLFNGLWGLNYDRLGIADQLQLNVQPYSTEELTDLLRGITGRLNMLDSPARQNRVALDHPRTVFKGAVQSYSDFAARDLRFAYASPSVKSSLFGLVDNYLGFGGYYNPFTGEAQVNTGMPAFSQPYTTCHEMAHQLGYAKENEANFVGYLAARSSSDKAFQYSVYFDLYLYAARELYARDSNLVRPIRESLRPGIRQDYRELKAFNRKYENPFEPIVRRLYGNYLMANHQPQGISTYNEVVAWLIAYTKKNGSAAL